MKHIIVPNFEDVIYKDPKELYTEVCDLKEDADLAISTLTDDLMDRTLQLINSINDGTYVIELDYTKELNDEINVLHDSLVNITALAKWYGTLIDDGYKQYFDLKATFSDDFNIGRQSNRSGRIERFDNKLLFYKEYGITENDIEETELSIISRYPLFANFLNFHGIKSKEAIIVLNTGIFAVCDEKHYYFVYHLTEPSYERCPSCGNKISKDSSRCGKCGYVMDEELQAAITSIVKNIDRTILNEDDRD